MNTLILGGRPAPVKRKRVARLRRHPVISQSSPAHLDMAEGSFCHEDTRQTVFPWNAAAHPTAPGVSSVNHDAVGRSKRVGRRILHDVELEGDTSGIVSRKIALVGRGSAWRFEYVRSILRQAA